MKILICPDKFKGSMSAEMAADVIRRGLNGCECEIILVPLADGGEGSLKLLHEYVGGEMIAVDTCDPLKRPMVGHFLRVGDQAYIEMAEVNGLQLLQLTERNPCHTTTFGTGKVIQAAINHGCTEIHLFVGGSATNDGGAGLVQALGVEFYDAKNRPVNPTGGHLGQIDRIEPSTNYDRIALHIYTDVNNPLLGTKGATYTYARQKGAKEHDLALLEAGMKNLLRLSEEYLGKRLRNMPGLGAAGGISLLPMAFFSATIASGFDKIAECTNLEALVRSADVVISGEGKLDKGSFDGKVVGQVFDYCARYQKPLYLFVGRNELGNKTRDVTVFELTSIAQNNQEAILYAEKLLQDLVIANQYILIT